jgi:hypothetical protein
MYGTWSKWRIPWVLAFAGTAVLLIAACNKQSAPAQAITIEHEVTPQPVHVGAATITLRLADASRKAVVTGAQITLEGNMSHAGMAPVFATAKEIEPGRYQAPLALSMAGDWVILVHLTLSDGQKLDQQFEIPGVRSD